MNVPRRHPTQLGECMECGAPADPVSVLSLSCFRCLSDQIRIYAEEDALQIPSGSGTLLQRGIA